MEFLEQLWDFYQNQALISIKDTDVTLSKIVAAFVIIYITHFISRFIDKKIQEKVLSRFKLDDGVKHLISKGIFYLIVILGYYIALESVGIPLTALTGFMALLGVGIGFGLQNITSNFISGVILMFERPIKVGDRITVGDVVGDVVKINLRTTIVNTPDNISIIVPNSHLLENNLVNWTYGDRRIRINVEVGVAYGSDVKKVTELLLQAAKENSNVLTDPEPIVGFVGFGNSSLDFKLFGWIPDSNMKPGVSSSLRYAIDELFRKNDIEIPFPQQDLHIRSSELENFK